MDLLSSLIKEKKTAVSKPKRSVLTGTSSTDLPKAKTRFTRRGDEAEAAARSAGKSNDGSGSGVKRARQLETNGEVGVSEGKKARMKLPVAEVKDRLRSRGQPITLFGESDEQRYDRLRHVETSHHDVDGIALQGAYAMRNTFLDNRGFKKKKKKGSMNKEKQVVGDGDQTQLEVEEKETETEEMKEKVAGERGELSKKDDGGSSKVEDASGENAAKIEMKKKKHSSKEKHIYRFIKQMLGEWEEELETRPDEEKRKAQGRQALKTFKQCKDYIRPFLKKLKAKSVEDSILYHVDKIVSLCEERQYIEAADWYVRLAIGNSPWPIGVTMVGIHERSGRERIESSKVAHVMNDEEQRKYITSMKRIMTFCQKKYPTDHSKMLQ